MRFLISFSSTLPLDYELFGDFVTALSSQMPDRYLLNKWIDELIGNLVYNCTEDISPRQEGREEGKYTVEADIFGHIIGRQGESVLNHPPLVSLHAKWPGWKIHFLCHEETKVAFAGFPLNNCLTLNKALYCNSSFSFLKLAFVWSYFRGLRWSWKARSILFAPFSPSSRIASCPVSCALEGG